MTSDNKIVANRKNALKSTCPKIDDGKAAVRWNDLKHGLLAKEIIINEGDGQESEADFRQILDSLIQDLQPHGTLKHFLVKRIAACYWRLVRVIWCERGEIR